jgi:hypothetical protein
MLYEFDEFLIDNRFLSECCGAPIYGEIFDNIGLCSQCKEWSGIIKNKDVTDE